MCRTLSAAIAASLAIVAIMTIGAQNASAQNWCSPCQGTYSSSCNTSSLNVVHGTYYRPLDPNFRAPTCGWAFYSGPAEVLAGNYLGNCTVSSRGTGRIVQINQWLHFYREPVTVQNYCPPPVRNECLPKAPATRSKCAPEDVLQAIKKLKAAPVNKELVADF